MTGPAAIVIRHQDALAQQGIDEYLAAVSDGKSVLVRPQESLAWLDRIAARFRSLSNRPTLITDLAGMSVLMDPESGSARDEAILGFHTSGSTGSPKCVIYERKTVNRHAAAIASALNLNKTHRFLALPPIRYAYGLSILHSHHLADVPVTFVNVLGGLSDLGVATTAKAGNLAIYLLPQHTPLLLSADLPPHSVARLIVAGGRLSAASAESLSEAFPNATLDNMYGQAEMGPRLSMWSGPLAEFREGNIGWPIPGVDLRLAGDPTDPQPREILARSEYSMRFWMKSPYEEVRDGPGPDEFIGTGDLGTQLDSGEIIHHGRADRWLNVAGTRVDLATIERLIDSHYHPLLVKASGEPARVSGDSVIVVQIVEGSDQIGDLAAVHRLLHQELGGLASMVRVRVVEQLSVSDSGK